MEQSYCEVESENVMMIDLLNQIETIVSNNSLNLTKIEKANVNQTHPGQSEKENCSYEVINNYGKPKIMVECKRVNTTFFPEVITSMILKIYQNLLNHI